MIAPLRVMIVDDERLAIQRLEALLDLEPDVTVVGSAMGCAEASAAIQKLQPDLLLLDIKMRDGSAFDLLSTLDVDPVPLVALVTAYPRFATQAFSIDAIDYVLKPASPERLRAAIARARHRHAMLDSERRIAELNRIVEQLREDSLGEERAQFRRDFWIREHGNRQIRVLVDDVDWFSAADDYVALHTAGREYLIRASLDRIEDMLDPAVFVRIHRSTIVQVDRIQMVRSRPRGGKEVVMPGGKVLAVGRTHARALPWRSG